MGQQYSKLSASLGKQNVTILPTKKTSSKFIPKKEDSNVNSSSCSKGSILKPKTALNKLPVNDYQEMKKKIGEQLHVGTISASINDVKSSQKKGIKIEEENSSQKPTLAQQETYKETIKKVPVSNTNITISKSTSNSTMKMPSKTKYVSQTEFKSSPKKVPVSNSNISITINKAPFYSQPPKTSVKSDSNKTASKTWIKIEPRKEPVKTLAPKRKHVNLKVPIIQKKSRKWMIMTQKMTALLMKEKS